MAETIIITLDKLREFYPVSKNMNEDRVNPYILRAQQRELKPFLGEALYFDFVNDIDADKYKELLDGIDYKYNGNDIFFGGVAPLLASFAYAQLIVENPIHIARAGNKTKTDENSFEVDYTTTNLKANEAKSEAVRLQQETRRFLDTKKSVYTLWGKGLNIDTPTEQGFQITKIPRSVQR